jgi:hypothetical protein
MSFCEEQVGRKQKEQKQFPKIARRILDPAIIKQANQANRLLIAISAIQHSIIPQAT